MGTTIEDGTTTITFDGISAIRETIELPSNFVRIIPKVNSNGENQVVDTGYRKKMYQIEFYFIDTSGGDSCLTKCNNLISIWKTSHINNKYQRKLIYDKPGTVLPTTGGFIQKVVYGKIQNISTNWIYGEPNLIEGKMDFVPDNISEYNS